MNQQKEKQIYCITCTHTSCTRMWSESIVMDFLTITVLFRKAEDLYLKKFEGKCLGLKLFNNKMRGHESMVIGDTARAFSLSALQELLHDWETCCCRKPWECFQLFSGYVLSCDYWHVWKKLAGHCTMTTKKKWGHMVPMLRSCVWPITFPTKKTKNLRSQWRLEEGERRKGGKVPSVIQQAVTHLIYLPVDHCGPVSYLAVVPTRAAAPKVRSTLTWQDKTFWDKTSGCVRSGCADHKLGNLWLASPIWLVCKWISDKF